MNLQRTIFLLCNGYIILLIQFSASKGPSFANDVEPSFAEPIPNVTVTAGRSVTLPCIVDDIQNYKVAWIHRDRHTLLTLHDRVITRNHRYTISHNSFRTWWLHISEVEEGDRGEYMCQINTSPMKSQVGYLNVVVPPRIDETLTSCDTDVREGGDVTLTCGASGSPLPKIKWRREDQKDTPEGLKLGSSGVEGELLNISKVSRLHMGAYLCIASNGVQPSVSKRIMLNVNFAPMIWMPNQLLGAPIDDDALLECSLESHPKSVTYWMRDEGIMILSNAKYDSVLIDSGLYKAQMQLRIRDVNPKDYGSYTCVAKNSLGETEGRMRLYEIPRPTTSSSTSRSISKAPKTEGTHLSTSEKIFAGNKHNSVVKDEIDASKKTEYPTQLHGKDNPSDELPSAIDHGFRKQGTNKVDMSIQGSSSSSSIQSTSFVSTFIVLLIRLIKNFTKCQQAN